MTTERRRSNRRQPDSGEALSWARLRTGAELTVLEISHHGALVETQTRLLPGTHVDLHLLTAAGRVLQRARISRAAVERLDPAGLTYRVALAFHAAIDSSPPRVAGPHAGSSAGVVATQPNEETTASVENGRQDTNPRPRQLAPLLESGPAPTSDL